MSVGPSVLSFFQKNHIDDKIIAVGVSGGADSLALVLQLHESLQPKGRKVIALTVDHGLRAESAEEAQYVHDLMEKEGIEHHILKWEGQKPKTGIEELARQARYKLLSEWCLVHNIHCLCVAHHLQDQAETFLIRLQRGSGLNGLCGMQEVSEMYGLKVLRPFLNTSPDVLKDYLQRKGVAWVTDSSNDCDDFLRVRIRKFLPQMESAVAITPQRLVDTMAVLSRSRDYIKSQEERFIKHHVRFWDDIGVSIALSVLEKQHSEIIYLVLADLIKQIGQSDYTARADDIERLAMSVLQANFKGATLGHCEIFVSQGKLWIVPELKLKNRLPKKIWEEFVVLYPQYEKQKIPYKMRVSLVKVKMAVEF